MSVRETKTLLAKQLGHLSIVPLFLRNTDFYYNINILAWASDIVFMFLFPKKSFHNQTVSKQMEESCSITRNKGLRDCFPLQVIHNSW